MPQQIKIKKAQEYINQLEKKDNVIAYFNEEYYMLNEKNNYNLECAITKGNSISELNMEKVKDFNKKINE